MIQHMKRSDLWTSATRDECWETLFRVRVGPPLRIMGSDKYIGHIILLKKYNNHMFVNFPTLILTHICSYFPF